MPLPHDISLDTLVNRAHIVENFEYLDTELADATGDSVQTANTVKAGPVSGAAAAPAYRALVAADIPDLDAAKVTTGQFAIGRLASGTPDGTKFVRDDGTLATPAGGGGGVTDHGALTGLADDDHPQYAKLAGDTFVGPLRVKPTGVNGELEATADATPAAFVGLRAGSGYNGKGLRFHWGGAIEPTQDNVPTSSACALGTTTNRFSNVASVNADFSGNVAAGSFFVGANKIVTGQAALVDAATVAIDVSLGEVLTLSTAVSRALGVPTGAVGERKGRKIRIKNTGASPITITPTVGVAGAFRFNSDITAIPAIAAGKKISIGIFYDSDDQRWDIEAVSGEF